MLYVCHVYVAVVHFTDNTILSYLTDQYLMDLLVLSM